MKRKADTMSSDEPKSQKLVTEKTYEELKHLVVDRKLSIEHAHPRDSLIIFDEEPHDYYVKWPDGTMYSKKDILSVTTMISGHFSPFDGPVRAEVMASERKPKHISEYGEDMTAQSIQDTWKESARLGVMMHLQIERFYNGELKPGDADFPTTREFRMFLKFASEHAHLRPYRTEWIVFTDPSSRLCGSIDMVFVSDANDVTRTLTVELVDWKRAKTITMPNRYFKKGKEGSPCADLCGVNFNKYSLQLNVYAWILETYYGGPPNSGPIKYNGKTYDRIKVGGMRLIKCHPNHRHEDYKSYTVADMRDKVKELVAHRVTSLLPVIEPEEPDEATLEKMEDFLSTPFTEQGPEELKKKCNRWANAVKLSDLTGISQSKWTWYLNNTYPDNLPYKYLKHHYNW